jgi:hypothetical protein
MELQSGRPAVRAFDVALAWVLLGVFGALARHRRPGLGRSLLLAALRRAARPDRSCVQDLVPAARPDRSCVQDPAAAAPGVVAAFQRAARGHRLAGSCLPRALALQRLLAWRGLEARVRLGLEPGTRPRAGHAWVECGGVPVGDDPSLVARYRACRTS